MKKLLLCLIQLASLGACVAQAPYYFSKSNVPYQPLTNATVLPDALTWSFNPVPIPIGFHFVFYDHSMDSVEFFSPIGSVQNPATPEGGSAIDAYFYNRATMDSTQESKLSYVLEGATGSRIFKIQASNFGLGSMGTTDYVNFQVWLYEGTNTIQYRYGPSSITTFTFPDGGPRVFLAYNGSNTDYYGCFLTGPSANPTFVQTSNGDGLSDYPQSGTVYTFSFWPNGINDIISEAWSVYPSPATNYLKIEGVVDLKQIEIYDVAGSWLCSPILQNGNDLFVGDLPKGIYFVRIQTGNGWGVKKFVKQ